MTLEITSCNSGTDSGGTSDNTCTMQTGIHTSTGNISRSSTNSTR